MSAFTFVQAAEACTLASYMKNRIQRPMPDFDSSDLKQIARLFVRKYFCDMARSSPKQKFRYFTLPGPGIQFELEIWQAYRNVSFEGVERIPSTFTANSQLIKDSKLPFKLHPMEDLDFFATTQRQYDGFWLDYCGPWTPKKAQAIDHLFSRKLFRFRPKSRPVLAVTFLEGFDMRTFQGHLVIAKQESHRQGDNLNFLARLSGIARLMSDGAIAHNCSLKPLLIVRYRDTTSRRTARPMMLFLFEVYPTIREFDIWKTDFIDLLLSDPFHAH